MLKFVSSLLRLAVFTMTLDKGSIIFVVGNNILKSKSIIYVDMKSTKEEIQAIKTLLKDSSTAKYHKRLQIVLFCLMGKSYKEIIELLDCNQTRI